MEQASTKDERVARTKHHGKNLENQNNVNIVDTTTILELKY